VLLPSGNPLLLVAWLGLAFGGGQCTFGCRRRRLQLVGRGRRAVGNPVVAKGHQVALHYQEADTLHDLWETINFGSIFAYGPSDDPDNDGLTNFQEFAFGTDPTVYNGSADVRFSIVSTGTGGRMTVQHSKHILALAMVTYTYETSTDLKVWTDTTSGWRETADPQNLNGYIEWVTMGYDLPTFPERIFVRVRAKPVPQ
jgi:hypothetical protein